MKGAARLGRAAGLLAATGGCGTATRDTRVRDCWAAQPPAGLQRGLRPRA